MTGAWVVVGVVVAAIVAGVGLMLLRWRKATHVPWVDLPDYRPGAQWFSEAGVDPIFLAKALQAAEGFLASRTTWGEVELASVGRSVRVYIMASESWTDLWGRKVAGLQLGPVLMVGPSLAALCHEMAHLCEELLDKEVDASHARWAGDGILAAIDDFDTWLGWFDAYRRSTGILPTMGPATLRRLHACRHAPPEAAQGATQTP